MGHGVDVARHAADAGPRADVPQTDTVPGFSSGDGPAVGGPGNRSSDFLELEDGLPRSEVSDHERQGRRQRGDARERQSGRGRRQGRGRGLADAQRGRVQRGREARDGANDLGVAALGGQVEGVDPGLVGLGAGEDCVGDGGRGGDAHRGDFGAGGGAGVAEGERD